MLELKNLCAGYGNENILKSVALQLHPGQLTAVIGPNGSGKSTLLKAVAGLIPTSGEQLLVDGVDAVSTTRQQRARKLAYLAQANIAAEMTVEALVLQGRYPHLRYPRRYRAEDRAAARAAMEKLGLLPLAEKPLTTLSGGMRQNAWLAMALAQDTDYILLDEPTTYLDIAHQQALMQLLRRFAREGKGILAVMHDLPLAFSFAHRVVVLQEGQIVAQGTPKEVWESGIIGRVFGVPMVYCPEDSSFRIGYHTDS